MSGARKFFSADEEQIVVKAITEAEKFTSGEIRLHLAESCSGDPVQEAQKVFVRLGMHKTADRNGVLIFIAPGSKKVAIVGDEAIHRALGSTFWDEMIARLIEGFRSEEKGEVVAACIVECGRMLSKHFPLKSGDTNELTNEISY
jgi:uncharacterized membrane protein